MIFRKTKNEQFFDTIKLEDKMTILYVSERIL